MAQKFPTLTAAPGQALPTGPALSISPTELGAHLQLEFYQADRQTMFLIGPLLMLWVHLLYIHQEIEWVLARLRLILILSTFMVHQPSGQAQK